MSTKPNDGARLTDEIPPWFCLENYKDIAELSGVEVLDAMQIRMLAYDELKSAGTLETGSFLLDDIQSGKPLKSVSDDRASGGCLAEDVEIDLLSEVLDVIHPLDYTDVEFLARMGIKSGKISPELEAVSGFESVSFGATLNKRAIVEIELYGNTNEQIIGALTQLLPEWRQELRIPEPTRVTPKVGESTIRKILDYNLIPWLDLEIWAKSKGVKINRGLLARTLFKEDFNKDGNWISDKTKGGLWFSRATDFNFIAQLRGFLATQPELAGRPVGRYRSRDS